MGDIMYTVDKIENDKVVIINLDNNDIIEENYSKFPENIKENDVVTKKGNFYVINKEKTNNLKQSTREKFDSLIK